MLGIRWGECVRRSIDVTQAITNSGWVTSRVWKPRSGTHCRVCGVETMCFCRVQGRPVLFRDYSLCCKIKAVIFFFNSEIALGLCFGMVYVKTATSEQGMSSVVPWRWVGPGPVCHNPRNYQVVALRGGVWQRTLLQGRNQTVFGREKQLARLVSRGFVFCGMLMGFFWGWRIREINPFSFCKHAS